MSEGSENLTDLMEEETKEVLSFAEIKGLT